MNADQLEQGEKVALGGALLVVFGAFLPWVSGTGIDGMGLFTLVFALLAATLVVTGRWERAVHRAVLGLGALTAVVALTAIPSASAVVNPGTGLYLTVVGGGALAVGGGAGYLTFDGDDHVVDPAD